MQINNKIYLLINYSCQHPGILGKKMLEDIQESKPRPLTPSCAEEAMDRAFNVLVPVCQYTIDCGIVLLNCLVFVNLLFRYSKSFFSGIANSN